MNGECHRHHAERIKPVTGLNQFLVALVCIMACFLGCQPEGTGQAASNVQPTSFEVRAARRAFDGAPPVIPHERLGADCTTCHTESGKEVPPQGYAPANPHVGDPQSGALSNCTQCHVFASAKGTFAKNRFQGLQQVQHKSQRAHPLAPSLIPHSVAMRANCQACHVGPSARQEIVCSHPERLNCTQCHVVSKGASDLAVAALAEAESSPTLEQE